LINLGDYEKLGWRKKSFNDLIDLEKCYGGHFEKGSAYTEHFRVIIRKYKFRDTGKHCWGIIIWDRIRKHSSTIWFEVSNDDFSLVLVDVMENYIEPYNFKLLFELLRKRSSYRIRVYNTLDILLEEGAEL